MKLAELQDGQKVRARRGRAGPESACYGPWEDVTLVVQRFVPKKTRRNPNPQSEIAAIDVKEWPDWAEYTPSDYAPTYHEFCVDDYYMQIEGLE